MATRDRSSVFVYGLADSDTGRVRYVGQSIAPLSRLRTHVTEAIRCLRIHHEFGGKVDERTAWLVGLLAKDSLPNIIILAEVPREKAKVTEESWIAMFKDSGTALFNRASWGVTPLSQERCGRARPRDLWNDEFSIAPYAEAVRRLMEEE